MPSAKAILIQSAVIVGIGAAIGLGDLIYRGGGVQLSLGDGGGEEKIGDLLNNRPPAKPPAEPEPEPAQELQPEPAEAAPKPDNPEPDKPEPKPEPDAVTTAPSAPAPAAPAAATMDCTSMEAPAHWPQSHITVAKAHALFETGQVVFVDARIEQDYLAGHVPGAHFLPVSAFEGGFPDRVMYRMDPDAVTIIYCSGGEDCEAAEDVAVELKAAGFTALRILHDGMPGWITCGHPVETGEDPNAF